MAPAKQGCAAHRGGDVASFVFILGVLESSFLGALQLQFFNIFQRGKNTLIPLMHVFAAKRDPNGQISAKSPPPPPEFSQTQGKAAKWGKINHEKMEVHETPLINKKQLFRRSWSSANFASL